MIEAGLLILGLLIGFGIFYLSREGKVDVFSDDDRPALPPGETGADGDNESTPSLMDIKWRSRDKPLSRARVRWWPEHNRLGAVKRAWREAAAKLGLTVSFKPQWRLEGFADKRALSVRLDRAQGRREAWTVVSLEIRAGLARDVGPERLLQAIRADCGHLVENASMCGVTIDRKQSHEARLWLRVFAPDHDEAGVLENQAPRLWVAATGDRLGMARRGAVQTAEQIETAVGLAQRVVQNVEADGWALDHRLEDLLRDSDLEVSLRAAIECVMSPELSELKTRAMDALEGICADQHLDGWHRAHAVEAVVSAGDDRSVQRTLAAVGIESNPTFRTKTLESVQRREPKELPSILGTWAGDPFCAEILLDIAPKLLPESAERLLATAVERLEQEHHMVKACELLAETGGAVGLAALKSMRRVSNLDKAQDAIADAIEKIRERGGRLAVSAPGDFEGALSEPPEAGGLSNPEKGS